jgi:hypothetical protein
MSQTAQFLWIGRELSAMERVCLNSFLGTGYRCVLYVYEPIKRVPEGVEQNDANEIIKFRDIDGRLATFSDLFRIHMLLKRGGWWFDMDFASIRMLPEPSDLRFASTWEFQYGQCAINAAIWCKPGDRRIGMLVEEAERILAVKPVPDYCEIGPFLIQRFVQSHSLQANVAPWWEFCPFPWRLTHHMAFESNSDWLKERVRLVKHFISEKFGGNLRPAYIRSSTRAVHWHNEIWKQSGLSKAHIYHSRSAYGRMQRLFG